jgi:hypothetical protein
MELTPAAPGSTLAGFEAAVGLVDDVNAALPAHQAVIAVPAAQGFQGVTDFHDNLGLLFAGYIRSPLTTVNASCPPVVTGPGVLYSPKRELKPCSAAVNVS